MRVIDVRNVCYALPAGLELLAQEGIAEDSRGGSVRALPYPVATVYRAPRERVLLTRGNPFFHLVEAVWMLAGQWDARLLDRYVSDFSSRFAEEGGVQHGAYGCRWRQHFDNWANGDKLDQLFVLIHLLRADPGTRQAVLAMWDPSADLGQKKRDLPCNTHVYFRVRQDPDVLDMTVCCRSNDLVWGAYGANAVHFSVLQEYVASMVGIAVGTYTQVSNNFHAYEKVLAHLPREAYEVRNLYNGIIPQRIVKDPETFDQEVQDLMVVLGEQNLRGPEPIWTNPFLDRTVLTAARAHALFKRGDGYGALAEAEQIESPDWRAACEAWLERRVG